MKSFLLFSVWYFLFPASVHWYLFTLILTYITVLPIPFVITSWVYSRHWCSEEMLTFNCFQSFICFNFWCLMNGFLSKSYFVTLWKETKLCKKDDSFGHFWNQVQKVCCHVQNQYPKICQNAELNLRPKIPNLGGILGIEFQTEWWNLNLLPYLKSAPSN